MGPRIGIPPPVAGGAKAAARHQLPVAYAEAVVEAGGVPLYLPPAASAAVALAAVDALLLPGGGDFLPPGEPPAGVAFDPVAPERLAWDRALLAAARAAARPVLGVCYGMQLVALESGGALVHHLPLERPAAGPHQLRGPGERHAVSIEPSTRLARIFGAGTLRVNSRHHQAVSDPGSGLRVCARAPDGVVEALEPASPDAPFLLGVQWHPEDLDEGHRRALFSALVAAAGAIRPAGGG
jgi:gamma-glutamyl-gamma-aminobutyrate hydrolase PuuD